MRTATACDKLNFENGGILQITNYHPVHQHRVALCEKSILQH